VLAAINAKWGTGDYKPIALLRVHHEPPMVFKFFRAAELCYVSSLHDGMNLVAKEFVAAHDDEQGVLMLEPVHRRRARSHRGADRQPVRPRAGRRGAWPPRCACLADEQRERMQSMRRLVSEFNVYRWAGRMLVDAAELRRRERMAGRWSAARALRRFA
jgi:trehalose 6-phosphate synthase